jgi:YhcH/YjgK/YiaL family protein
MIISDLEHITKQAAMTPALQKAINYLRRLPKGELPADKVEVDGSRVKASPSAYESIVTETPKMEGHRKYIDVQYIVSGEEDIAWTPVERIAVTQAYDENKDNFYGTTPASRIARMTLRAGQVMLLYPEDGHAPKLAVGGKSSPVKKIVVKVAVA